MWMFCKIVIIYHLADNKCAQQSSRQSEFFFDVCTLLKVHPVLSVLLFYTTCRTVKVTGHKATVYKHC